MGPFLRTAPTPSLLPASNMSGEHHSLFYDCDLSQQTSIHYSQLFFEESLINQVYEIEAYTPHLSTLDRVTNDVRYYPLPPHLHLC